MNVLIVGAGGREHALAWKCQRSAKTNSIHVTPGNGGIETLAKCWYTVDHEEIVKRAKIEKIELAIIGQEDYLVNGLTELLEAEGIQVLGPNQGAAQLEGSKVFARNFMQRHSIPSAKFEVFAEVDRAKSYLRTIKTPYVIKASGLAAGKGVFICSDLETADKSLEEIMVAKVFGDSGNQVLIEEFLQGEEASWFIFTDGTNYVSMPSLQDHKRQLVLDKGLNTGGMGCYSPAPVVTQEIEEAVKKEIIETTLRGMAAEGNPFKGILYIGLMINQGKPKVLEYNVRFGDPECQPLMMLLDSDLVEIAQAIAGGRLKDIDVKWKNQAAAIVILASGGYPKSYETGFTIQGLEQVAESDQRLVFHSGTKRDQNRFTTSGGRVLGVSCLGNNLQAALREAYGQIDKISWPGMQYRVDIGLKGLKRIITPKKGKNQVGIILGSASDSKVAEKAAEILERFGVNYDLIISSAHRTPERTRQYVKNAVEKGVEVFIAIAGMAAHLAGVIAAETELPVIGVPVNASPLAGQDALLSMVQMPPGIPVATVGIDRGDNAALLAVQILGLKYPEYQAFHSEYRLELEQKVINSNQR